MLQSNNNVSLPFNSKSMHEFAKERDLELETAAPYHPSSNPVETSMQPLGISFKIPCKISY